MYPRIPWNPRTILCELLLQIIYFKRPPRSRAELRSSELLRSELW